MSFSRPFALILFLLIPFVLWMSWLGTVHGSPRKWRDRISLLLRLFILALLILSIAGAQTVQAGKELSVVFMVDTSDSMTTAQREQAETLVRESLSYMGPQEKAAVIVFGAEPLVDRPLTNFTDLEPLSAIPSSLQTDIAAAIHLGLGLFPADGARRMVILSDGLSTMGDPRAAGQLAAAGNVAIDYVYLPRLPIEVEVTLVDVNTPAFVEGNDLVRLDLVVESTTAMETALRVFADQTLIHQETVELAEGTNNFSLRVPATGQEFIRYHVQVSPTEDTVVQNNDLTAFTKVIGPPQVLMVAADDQSSVDEAGHLQDALAATGSNIVRIPPQEFPVDLGELSQYASLVLVNVNLKDMSSRMMETVQMYVRDLGGGLAVVGGPNSYGMGGYFQTALEEALPLNMQIEDEERFPAVSIALVLDRSGSMAQEEGGLTKMQLAGEGAVRAVQLLHDFDEIAIIPVDTQVSDQIGPLPATDRERVIGLIREIQAGGGGIYFRTGLAAAAAALEESDNPVKHIIILADGADTEEKDGVPEIVTALAETGVTISVVSIGQGPDTLWLQQMADLGNGRFHLTDQAANLPQIYAQETISIQRNYLIEENTLPNLENQSPILSGFNALPALLGYVGTSPKESAQVILASNRGDPLLATWQYGLGRVATWTSDATSRWAVEWVNWERFPQFWGQVLDWTQAAARTNAIETAVVYEDGQAIFTLDIRDQEMRFVNDLAVEGNALQPDGETISLIISQVAPGRYITSLNPEEEGVYLLRFLGRTRDGEIVAAETIGWALGYSPEYRDLASDSQALATLAEITGGRDLSAASPQELATAVFSHDLPAQNTRRPVWTWLALFALLLLPVDVATRRLVVSRQDLAQAWTASVGRLFMRQATDEIKQEPVTRLFEAKKRVQKKSDLVPPRTTIKSKTKVEPRSDIAAAEPADNREVGDHPPQTHDQQESLASRLLKKKQERDNP